MVSPPSEALTGLRCMWLQVGAHDGDWEHVTMRLSADGSKVLGFYYSAHRCDHGSKIPAG